MLKCVVTDTNSSNRLLQTVSENTSLSPRNVRSCTRGSGEETIRLKEVGGGIGWVTLRWVATPQEPVTSSSPSIGCAVSEQPILTTSSTGLGIGLVSEYLQVSMVKDTDRPQNESNQFV